MKAASATKGANVRSFRGRLLLGMMLVVGAMTVPGLFLAQRKVQIEAELDLQRDFRNELAIIHGIQELRHAALSARCRILVERPRLHAALEDDALDLLYPTATDELRDLVEEPGLTAAENSGPSMQAHFYRFLDETGAVITPANATDVGALSPGEEAKLALPQLPEEQQLGYIPRESGGGVDEIIAMPISSTETGEIISALVFGFIPVELGAGHDAADISNGIWVENHLHLPGVAQADQKALGNELSRWIASEPAGERSHEVQLGGVPHLFFYKQLNPGSMFPPAYEVAVYSLAAALAWQKQIRFYVIVASGALLLIGLVASHLLSRRLARPVEQLAVHSEQNRAQRARAEAALESTSVELQRSARFSADASHQLKTPVTVLRAGIEELLAREDFAPKVYHELAALLHQTYRITGVVDDLLLLSRMDAGRLQIQFGMVNLTKLIEEWVDDLSALPDELDLTLRTDVPADVYVAGERRYITLVVQNLLENARKYNRAGGTICVAAREEAKFVVLTVENTGKAISAAARDHIFERFNRGGAGENVPGHGLGLNLARELARLHGGDLRLTHSDDEWTEFEVRLRTAGAAIPVAGQPA